MKDEIENKVKEISSKIDEGVKDVLTSDRYKKYLSAMSKFHKYSYNNSILIFLQNENATYVAGFNTWKNKFNRTVNKGEKGIKILAPTPFKITQKIEIENEKGEKVLEQEEILVPRFKVVNVFDVSQTSGEKLPTIAEELQGNIKDYNKLFEAIKKCSNYEISFKDIKEKGFCSGNKKEIVIKENMSEIQTIKTLIHEISHEKLHFKEEQKEQKTSANQAEIEAESIAYIVSNYFGIDTSSYSFDYISSWQEKDLAEVKSSLKIIQETASNLIFNISENLSVEREKSITAKIEKAKTQTKTSKEKNVKKSKNKDVSL